MSEYENIQVSFLNLIKKRIPANVSLADELSDILNISRDSAYRRLRGDTILSLDEVQKLSNHYGDYGVSLDTLLNTQNDSITFQYRSINNTSFTFLDYLESILSNMRTLRQFDERMITYLAKDVPPWHHFQFEELAEFKCFFWLKTIMKDPTLDEVRYAKGCISSKYLQTGFKILEEYVQSPSVEIWSYETINITLRQLEFYLECGFFENPADALAILDHFETLIHHIENQAQKGYMFIYGHDEGSEVKNYQLYSNEVNIADQTVFFKMKDTMITYLVHNNFNILTTTHYDFCKGTEEYINNIMAKSSLISSSSQKERNRFFNRLQKKIDKTRKVMERYV